MSASAVPTTRTGELLGEVAKLPAFLRRDMLVAWSYRAAFFADFAELRRADAAVLLHREAGAQRRIAELRRGSGDLSRVRDARRGDQRLRAGRADPHGQRPAAGADDRHARAAARDPDGHRHGPVRLRGLRPDLHADPHGRLPGLHGGLRRRRPRTLGDSPLGRDPAGLHPVRVGAGDRQRGGHPDLQARHRRHGTGRAVAGPDIGGLLPAFAPAGLDRGAGRVQPARHCDRGAARSAPGRHRLGRRRRGPGAAVAAVHAALLAGTLAFRLALRREQRRGTLGLY